MLWAAVAVAARGCVLPFVADTENGRSDTAYYGRAETQETDSVQAACEYAARRHFGGDLECVWQTNANNEGAYFVRHPRECDSCVEDGENADLPFVRQCGDDAGYNAYSVEYSAQTVEDAVVGFVVNVPDLAVEAGFADPLCAAACTVRPGCGGYMVTDQAGCVLMTGAPPGRLASSTQSSSSTSTSQPHFLESEQMLIPARTAVKSRSLVYNSGTYATPHLRWEVITDDAWVALTVLETDKTTTTPALCGELCHAELACSEALWIGPWDGCRYGTVDFWQGPDCETFADGDGPKTCTVSDATQGGRRRRQTGPETHAAMVFTVDLIPTGEGTFNRWTFWVDPFVDMVPAGGNYECVEGVSHVRFTSSAATLQVRDCPWIEEVHVMGAGFQWQADSFAGCPRLRRVLFNEGLIYSSESPLSGCVSYYDQNVLNQYVGVHSIKEKNQPNVNTYSSQTAIEIDCIPCDPHPEAPLGGLGRKVLAEEIILVNRRFYADCPHLTRVYAPGVISNPGILGVDSWPRSPTLVEFSVPEDSIFVPYGIFSVVGDRTGTSAAAGVVGRVLSIQPCVDYSLVVNGPVPDHLFRYCLSVAVWMQPTVTSIGERSFGNMDNLRSVQFSATLTAVDADAFGGSTGITSLLLPENARGLWSTLAEDIAAGGCTCPTNDVGLLCKPEGDGGFFGVCDCQESHPGCFFDIDPAHHRPRRAVNAVVHDGVCGDLSPLSVVGPVLDPASDRLFDLPGTIRVSISAEGGDKQTVLVPIGQLAGFCDGRHTEGLETFAFPATAQPVRGVGPETLTGLPVNADLAAHSGVSEDLPGYGVALIAIGSAGLLLLVAKQLALF